MHLLHIGFGNIVPCDRIISVLSSESASARRLRESAFISGRLIDATQGRKTRSIIVVDSSHIVLSSLSVGELAQRLTSRDSDGIDE